VLGDFMVSLGHDELKRIGVGEFLVIWYLNTSVEQLIQVI